MNIVKVVIASVVFVFLFIINIRVETGNASSFERALDGLVGVAVLITLILYAFAILKK